MKQLIYKNSLVVLLIFIVIWSLFRINSLETENQEITALLDETDLQLSEYKDALSSANEQIDAANSRIEEAKWSAWDNYETMGDTLENLDTVDTVDEP